MLRMGFFLIASEKGGRRERENEIEEKESMKIRQERGNFVWMAWLLLASFYAVLPSFYHSRSTSFIVCFMPQKRVARVQCHKSRSVSRVLNFL